MAFADTLKTLPFTPRTQNAAGFLPPLVRSMGHIINLLVCVADEKIEVTDDEALEELRQAHTHWDARTAATSVSTNSADRAVTIGKAIEESIAEYGNWNNDTRIANLRDLSHRILQYTADLDRELVGLRDSDPGSAL